MHLGLCLVAVSVLHAAYGYLTYIEVRLPLPGERAPPGAPWPQPKEWKRTDRQLSIDPKTFYMTANMGDCDVVEEGLRRYKKHILIDDKGARDVSLPLLEGVGIQVDDKACGYPKHKDDESYTIKVPQAGAAVIQAKTIWGALRGIETFSQLVYQDDNRRYLINATDIVDEPRYKYRGILLDTSRHFLPVKTLKQNLDAMSYNKFNVFHWHIVDDQSFPFESKIFPNLTALGAYSPKHVYTHDNIRDIIQYARLRGIRVIPEFDTPGHTQALGRSFPEILTPCYGEGPDKPYTPNYPEHHTAEILNPMIDKTYDIVLEIIKEIQKVFVDEYIHLGMDEVYYACWKSSPEVKKFMDRNGYKDYNEVEQHYVRRTLENVRNVGYKYIIWQDPIDNDVKASPDSIVGVWKDKYLDIKFDYWEDYIVPIAKKGYQMVLSACWYLNYISYGQDWKKYYECDPRSFNGTEEEKDLVIGGEACMWGEYVDGTNIIARLWPRASAVAEKLWSPIELTKDVDSAAFRLDQHRCRMLRRGIPTQPILNGFCGDYEWDIDAE